ncbi:hypothetical protein BaRGS_00012308 [Batillaria attramentaria]|uniref:Beta-lactamase-related domain-containing protein n=1 Tax=Batillaria attramentaria TaxID=370345 RepID=A0ABD0LAS8_9CAEN
MEPRGTKTAAVWSHKTLLVFLLMYTSSTLAFGQLDYTQPTTDKMEHTRNTALTKNRRQPAPPALSKREVLAADHFFDHVMKCGRVPGMSVAVVKDGKTWTRGYGVKDLTTMEPVDSSTLFAIGSLTKAFTSALLGVALEKQDVQKVTWQTLLQDVLGDDFKLVYSLEKLVKIGDVLSHRTGLMAADILVAAGFPSGLDRGEFIRRLRYLPDWGPYGYGLHYNNWVYSLAGDVTSKLLEQPWKVLLKDYLLDPLGMHEAKVVWHDVNVTSPKMARPYQEILGVLEALDESLFNADQAEASGALATSADDMTRWMQFLLNKGVSAGGQRILDPKTLATIMTSHVSLTHTFDVPVEDVVKGYGFGWYTGSYRGKRKVLHTGEWFGYQASLQLFPDHHAAVYVAESGPGTAAGFDAINSISYYLADIALGYSPWVNETVACSLVEEARKANEREGKPKPELSNEELGDASDEFIVPVENAQRYTGTFGHPFFGEVEIAETANDLHTGLLFRFQRLEGFLLPVGDQRDLADLKTIDFIVQYTGKTEFYSYEFETAEYSELSFVTSRGGSDDKYDTLVLSAPWPQDDEKLTFERNVKYFD